MPLYEVAIIEKPTRRESESGVNEKLVYGPKPVIARNAQNAVVVALLGGDKPEFDVNKVEVLVRLFAGPHRAEDMRGIASPLYSNPLMTATYAGGQLQKLMNTTETGDTFEEDKYAGSV